MRLGGDTDFSQTKHWDGWHEPGDVRFVFGYDNTASLQVLADDLPKKAWKRLHRPATYVVQTKRRRKPARVKPALVEAHVFKDIRLVDEGVAEMKYRPTACRRAYRLVVVRKNLKVRDPKQGRLFDDYVYFFYITNDGTPRPRRSSSPPRIAATKRTRSRSCAACGPCTRRWTRCSPTQRIG